MTLVNAVLYGADDVVGAHVGARLRRGAVPDFQLHYAPDNTRLFAALGVTRPGLGGNRQLLGGAVYHNFQAVNGQPVCIEVSIAFDRAGWASCDTLWQLFAYPFEPPPLGLGCAVMVARIRRGNVRSRRLAKGLGFALVGPVPHGFDGREDVMLYAMAKEGCRWLRKTKDHGQVIPGAAAVA